jgi:hypothetical protein
MAYADALRAVTPAPTGDDIADLIEGIFASTFPLTWTSWSPSYSAGGSMTYTSVTTSTGRYIQIGKLVFFKLIATGTTGGSASTHVKFTLPVNQSTTHYSTGSGFINEAGTITAGFLQYNSTTTMEVHHYNDANWTLGATRLFNIQGFYEAA